MPTSSKESSSYRSQRRTVGDLSLLEKLDTISIILAVLTTAIGALLKGPFRSIEKSSKSYYRYVALSVLRKFITRSSVRQQHYLTAPTDDAYRAACKKRRFTPNSEILEDGTQAHWLGSSKAEKLLLNFHGGGYVVPASPEMFEFMFQIVDLLNKNGKNVACLMLSYDLAPGAVYPRQLQQASMFLNHVVNKLLIEPNNIILSGDSAGANLALALVSHISHPHPSTTLPIPKFSVSSPFRGLVLISPWVSFDLTYPSFAKNEYKDLITTNAGMEWSSAFLACPWPHTSASDYYNQAITAPSSWWKDIPVQEVFIVVGDEEVLLDGITKFERQFTEGFGEGKVEFKVFEGEYHDQPSIDLQLGYKESQEGETAKAIKGWIVSRL
ncbi:Alpha/Beta hydrolase protein [Cadophora sp. MPI-SDFR-AT-0126]|nr:Alpha/Beta hydrolase protein [Leotiomycetes sp. MPI-SDFR-AT-0126]